MGMNAYISSVLSLWGEMLISSYSICFSSLPSWHFLLPVWPSSSDLLAFLCPWQYSAWLWLSPWRCQHKFKSIWFQSIEIYNVYVDLTTFKVFKILVMIYYDIKIRMWLIFMWEFFLNSLSPSFFFSSFCRMCPCIHLC